MVLDGACTDGTSLDPMIVFKTEELREGYFVEEEDIASTIMVGKSSNSWTSSALALGWLERNFGAESQSACKAKDKWRMLTLDHGHSTQLS
ncbi:hypothetical protein L873DRAFT_1908381 [Choiromyces venosus 120613-1]|uniref:DDE-1 domain-containing protein n=1 Tax=Choiromyces venosus 120613-1 TaxID=1336337 RepID=A0A3N4K3C6_9PEZI|nr:hypothetical protein L873DRAFT_1908381 [Choiromyces venosus 120613-1]